MNATALLTNLLSAAKTAIPFIGGPVGEAVKSALAAGSSISSAIGAVKHLVSDDLRREADVTQAELDATIARVNAHAQHTIDSLGGQG